MPPTTSPSATPREVPVRPTRIPWARKIRRIDRKSTRMNSSHDQISYAVFCLKKKNRPVLVRSDRKSTRLNTSHDQNSYFIFCLKITDKQRQNVYSRVTTKATTQERNTERAND